MEFVRGEFFLTKRGISYAKKEHILLGEAPSTSDMPPSTSQKKNATSIHEMGCTVAAMLDDADNVTVTGAAMIDHAVDVQVNEVQCTESENEDSQDDKTGDDKTGDDKTGDDKTGDDKTGDDKDKAHDDKDKDEDAKEMDKDAKEKDKDAKDQDKDAKEKDEDAKDQDKDDLDDDDDVPLMESKKRKKEKCSIPRRNTATKKKRLF